MKPIAVKSEKEKHPDKFEGLRYCDPRIHSLCLALNMLPAIETFSSCGGHPGPADGCRLGEGEFYVDFYVARTPTGWKSLSDVVEAMEIELDNTEGGDCDLKVGYVGGPCREVGDFCPMAMCFSLNGHEGFNPDSIAERLKTIGKYRLAESSIPAKTLKPASVKSVSVKKAS